MGKPVQLLKCRCSPDGSEVCVGKCDYVCAKMPAEFAATLSPVSFKAWITANPRKREKAEHQAFRTIYF